jgi:signal transduction histidine kinase
MTPEPSHDLVPPRRLSLARQSWLIVALTAVLLAMLLGGGTLAIRAARERLFERAQGEARLLALAPGSLTCATGIARQGRVEGPDLATLGAELVQRARARPGQLVEVSTRTPGPSVWLARANADASLDWWRVDVREPVELRRWFLGMAAVGGLLALIALLSVRGMLTLRRASATFVASLDSLQGDLTAPAPVALVEELVPVSLGVDALTGRLRAALARQRELDLALAREERLSALGRVAAGIAHEVRTPLASMKLRVDLLLGEGAGEPFGADLAHIDAEIHRLERLLEQLLAFVRGKVELRRQPVDLAALLEARAEGMRPLSEDRGVRVQTTGSGLAELDADAIARVIDNLLKNAIEASARGGEVTVSVQQEARDLVIAVSDQGPGVPAEFLPRLFEPFATGRASGTGLGLAIARGIAQSHGGSLEYRRGDARTIFQLRLPRAGGALR